jgi:hypothetical protein
MLPEQFTSDLLDGKYYYSTLVRFGRRRWTYAVGTLNVVGGMATIETFEMNQHIPSTLQCEEFSCAPYSGTYELKGDGFTVTGSTKLIAKGCKGDHKFEVPVLFSPHWLGSSRQDLQGFLTNASIAAVTHQDEGAYCSGYMWDT